jgi:SOS-response transcriptional repressor LexA
MPSRFDKHGKQLRLLQAIADHIWLYGYQPSLRELAKLFRYSSVGYIQFLLTDLREKKVVHFANTARGVAFRWQDYVTEEALSRHNGASVIKHPRGRAATKGRQRRRKPVGEVSESR